MTPKELSAQAKVSRSLVYKLLRDGKLPGYRVGCNGRGKYLLRWEDWEKFLETCRLSEPQEEGQFDYL